MSTFTTINEKTITASTEIVIENLDISPDHWRSTKYINAFGSELELLYYSNQDQDQINKSLIKLFMGLNKDNPRISQIKFYSDKNDASKLICLTISDMTTFKPDNFLKRDMNFKFIKKNKTITISDLTSEEWSKIEKKEQSLPDNWQQDELLTNRYSKYKELFIA
jgi:hypothetical protein